MSTISGYSLSKGSVNSDLARPLPVVTRRGSIIQENSTELRYTTELEIVTESESSTSTSSEESLDTETYPDGGWKAYTVLFGSFLGFTVDFGLINSVGAVQSYINTHQLQGTSSSISSLIFSIFLAVSYISSIFSGVLFDEFGSKIPIAIGTIFLFLGLFLTGECNSVASFVTVFGLIAGTSLGFLIAPLGGVVSHHFKRKRAGAFGLATLGGSVGGVIFPLLLNHLYQRFGFKWAMRILSFLCTGMLVISLALCKERMKSNSTVSSNDLPISKQISLVAKNVFFLSTRSLDLKAFKDPAFLFCTIAAAFSELSLVCALTYYSSYIIYIGYSETQGNTLIMIVNAVGILGRFLPGLIADKIGPFNVVSIMIFGVAVSNLALWLGWCTNSQSLASLYTFAAVYGFFSSSALSLTPACCAAISPTKDFGKRYATLGFVIGLFFLGGLTAGGAIIGVESYDSYKNFIVYAGILAVIGDLGWLAARYCKVGCRVWVKL